MIDCEVKGIRKIQTLIGTNAFRPDQIIARGLRLCDNTTVGVSLGERGAGEISIGLSFNRGKSETGSLGMTVIFRDGVNLALLPPMAISTTVMVELLTSTKSLFGFKGLSARIFERVIREFGQVRLEIVPGARPGEEKIDMAVEIASVFRVSAIRSLLDLDDFIEKEVQKQTEG